MRVAIVDIGTNSTRLLIAEVGDGSFTELVRRSNVTRLGQGVDKTGSLAEEAMARVYSTLDAYRRDIDENDVTANMAVLTSAVRDATNGAEFTARVRDDYGLDARSISGDEEAAMTFGGATSERPGGSPNPVVVIDIGGGSTELVVGDPPEVLHRVSTQAGVVRQGERHVTKDPPPPHQLQALAAEVRTIFEGAMELQVRKAVQAGIAVAGTATSCAAIDLELDPYDPAKVHGYELERDNCGEILARLASMTDDERREVPGLHPDRAPTIVPGVIMLIEAMRAFGLQSVTVSEHDILRGAALMLEKNSKKG